jgi:hypothetical protein
MIEFGSAIQYKGKYNKAWQGVECEEVEEKRKVTCRIVVTAEVGREGASYLMAMAWRLRSCSDFTSPVYTPHAIHPTECLSLCYISSSVSSSVQEQTSAIQGCRARILRRCIRLIL